MVSNLNLSSGESSGFVKTDNFNFRSLLERSTSSTDKNTDLGSQTRSNKQRISMLSSNSASPSKMIQSDRGESPGRRRIVSPSSRYSTPTSFSSDDSISVALVALKPLNWLTALAVLDLDQLSSNFPMLKKNVKNTTESKYVVVNPLLPLGL
ncbi:hypothetical protein OGAPHI_004944 [Ogataea philodendri]|uniref:Uncharacterized protein n=1 Tax=Ogataea philodendri TaxID=1378263 RepID=A0A9P8T268_9ASCO|nr:uncharacterized protein OGAPHI_004944 [Ogataea philodendri]KAH3663543.1 hypothetical protein OGAPHI_004944 [Ogataea philodendri]